MKYIIDAHEDIAYNALSFGRNYLNSAAETRRLEADTPIPARAGHSLLGWPDFQAGQVALIFGTLFISPRRFQGGAWEKQAYQTTQEAAVLYRGQIDFYHRLCDDHPDQFGLVKTRQDLAEILAPWETSPAELPSKTHKVGIMISMEGAEGIRHPDEMAEFWDLGVRATGPVWAGTRFCGGTHEPGGFTREGFELLNIMAGLGFILDLAHMNEQSALQALDAYTGTVIASHANARALLKDFPGERHLSDTTIRRLAERGGVIGVLPFNKFLRPGWSETDDRSLVTLETLAAHIDHICQLTGCAQHVAVGTDFDGGFGWPSVPQEIDTIADLPKLEAVLLQRGYSEEDISSIFHGNWQSILERSLP
jgi:membrane dipeptidase